MSYSKFRRLIGCHVKQRGDRKQSIGNRFNRQKVGILA